MRNPAVTLFAFVLSLATVPIAAWSDDTSLRDVYANTLKQARYIDLTHAFTPTIPVWPGFAHAAFKPAVAGEAIAGYVEKGQEFTYAQHGFVATAYDLPTDQYGTQLDPPAHWDEWGATISDLPATYAVRPLVVIDVHDKVAADPGYHATVEDIAAWESRHGRIPEGSVVMIRSDWSKIWDNAQRFNDKPFPGVRLDALKFLHLERRSCSTATSRLTRTARPSSRARLGSCTTTSPRRKESPISIRCRRRGRSSLSAFAKPLGGTGGYARYVAIAPKDWPFVFPSKMRPARRCRDSPIR